MVAESFTAQRRDFRGIFDLRILWNGCILGYQFSVESVKFFLILRAKCKWEVGGHSSMSTVASTYWLGEEFTHYPDSDSRLYSSARNQPSYETLFHRADVTTAIEYL